MRIHEIDITNIASLKGHHHIDFDLVNSHSSLFAITGKTGSGKSTILNSISLALYNEVYKKDSQSNDFITLGESSGEIKLIFSTNNQYYMAFWQMKIKKKNGEYLKKPQQTRTLSIKTNGQYVLIEKNIEEIIHLNFDQFCKTSILNQGEFARFLTSKFTDRKTILEKFYDGIDLELINLKLREKLKLNKEQLEEKNNRIKGIEQAISEIEISETTVNKLDKNVHELKAIFTTLEKVSPLILDIKKQYRTIIDNEGRKEDLNLKQKESQKKYNVLKKENDQFKQEFTQAQEILKRRKPILDECIKKNIELKKNHEQKVSLIKQKNNYVNDKEYAEKSLKEIIQKLSAQDLKQKELVEQNSIIGMTKLEKIIPHLEQLKSLDDKVNSLETRMIATNQKLHIQNTKIAENQNKIEEVIKTISTYNTNETERSLENLDSKILGLSKLKDLIQNNLRSSSQLNQEVQTNEQEIEKFSLKQTQLNNEMAALNEKSQLYENTKKLYALHNAIHLCLESSIQEGHCVVCNNQIDLSTIPQTKMEESELTNAINKLEDLALVQTDLKSKQEQVNLQSLSLKSNQNRIKEMIGKLSTECLIEWNKYSELPLSQNVLKSTSLDPIEKIIKQCSTQLDSLNQKKRTFELNQQMKNHLDDQKKELLAYLSELNNELSSLKSEHTLTLKTFRNTLEIYKLDITLTRSSAIEKFNDLLQLVNSYVKSQELSEQLLQEKLRSTETQMSCANKIEDIGHAISKIIEQNNQLEEYILKNSTKDIPAEIELEKLQENHDITNHKLLKNKDELNIEMIFLAESKSKIENSVEQIRAASLMIKNHQKQLDLLMIPATKTHFLNKDLFSGSPALVDKFIQLDPSDLNLNQIIELSHEKFNELFERSKVLYRQTDKDLTEAKTLFKQKTDGLEQIKEIQEQANTFIHLQDKLKNLDELIGKDEFRNYILSIIETTLIEQTNKELNVLCNGRYSLCQSNKTNRLITEFKIIDHYADSMIRKISTLSGGETFLVSLAMALALAELTRGQTQLDSLFIDEGFGTLDSETIDEVFELLLTIQHSGKQIGIISHVKDLTSRIPININLEKNMAGMSKIQIINN